MEARLRDIMTWILGRAIGTIVSGLVALAFAQVVLRYLFNSSILWVEEVSVMALIWLAWLGIVYLWLTRNHIAVDLVGAALSAPARHRLGLGIDCLALVGGVVLVLVSLGTLDIYSGMEMGSLEIDASVKYYPITFGGAGLAIAAFLNLLEGLRRTAPAQ